MRQALFIGILALAVAGFVGFRIATDTDETPCEHDARLIREGELWPEYIGDKESFADAFLVGCKAEEEQDNGR